MATETTANVDEKIEKKLDEEVGGENEADENAEPAIAAPAPAPAPAPDSSAANELKEEKDIVLSDSQTVNVNETAPDHVLSQPEKQPATDSTSKETAEDSQKEPIKNEEPETFTEKSNERSEADPPTQVDSGKEEENSGLGLIETKPEHVAKDEEEQPTEIETKEIIDRVDEEQVKTVNVKADSPSQEEATKDTENSELGFKYSVGELKEEPSESEKEFTEKGDEQGEKVNIEESSAAPSDEPSDAIESNSPEESNEREVLEKELKEEKPQPVAIEVKEKPSVLATLNEELEGENQDAEDGLAPEDTKIEVEETITLNEDDTCVTESVELIPKEPEAHASVVESSLNEADSVEVAFELKKEELNETSEVEKVLIEELKKEELNEPNAVEVLSREVAEQVSCTQEAQVDTKEDEKDSSLPINAEEDSIDVENKEAYAVKVEEANKEESVKTKNEIPVSGNEYVTEAVKDQAEDMMKTDMQTSENHEEVQAKQKQSNNIFLKLKQSLAKAKKAITGKSPKSKTVSYYTKGDITAK